MTKAVFFDKDGTLIPDIPYNRDVELITFNEGAQEALQKLAEHSYKFFIISNQSGIARGFLNEADLEAIKRKLNEMFNELGVQLAGFYYCPHDREGTVTSYATHCDCRKPQPGMLFRAAREHSLDLSESWFIGDILNDVEAGNRAGCHTILLDNGNETEWIEGPYRNPDHKVSNLAEAAGLIIQHSYEKKETSA